jgi:hypothetical protein
VLIIVAAAIATVVRDMVTGALAARPAGRPLGTVAYWLIMSFGIIAALGQINIATTVTTPVLVTGLRRWPDQARAAALGRMAGELAGAIPQPRSAAASGGHLAAAERRS